MSSETVSKIVVLPSIIPSTIRFLREQGMKGLEGRVYWIGCRRGVTAHVNRIAIPEQIAVRTPFGVSVTVPQAANVKVARSLAEDEYIVAKVHSHPRRAYNSDTDKANPFLRHEGSVSIIVPDFARSGMNALANCAVCIFEAGRWVDLTRSQVAGLFTFQGQEVR